MIKLPDPKSFRDQALQVPPVLIASLSFVVLFLYRRQGIRWSHEVWTGLAFQWGGGLLIAATFYVAAVFLIPKKLSFRVKLASTLTVVFCAGLCILAWQVLERCRYGHLLDKDGIVCLARAGGCALLIFPLTWLLCSKGRFTRGLQLFLSGAALLALAGLLLSLIAEGWMMCSKLKRIPSGEQAKHIILYISDTTRMDAMGFSGNQDASTPHLNWLAEQSVIFERAYANSPWTPPSHASLFTGLLPLDHGMLSEVWLTEEVETLAEKLSREGYLTVGYSQNPYVSRQTNLAQGFHRFYGVSHYCERWDSEVEQLLVRVTRELRGQPPGDVYEGCMDMSRRVVANLDRYGDKVPLFIFVNAMPPHMPYHLTEEGRKKASRFLSEEALAALRGFEESREDARQYMLGQDSLSEDELQAIRALYDGEVAQVDAAVGELIEGLQSSGFWENTLFVFASDHGEEFGEHHLLGHGRGAYDTLLRVPLLMRCPWIPEWMGPSRWDGLVQLADLPATICQAVGLSWPEQDPYVGRMFDSSRRGELREIEGQYDRLPQIDGHSLVSLDDPFQEMNDRLVWRIGEETKVVLGDKGLRLQFHLSQDPEERVNRAEENDCLIEELRVSRCGEWLKAPRVAPSRSLDKKTVEGLKALGYLGG